MRRPTSGKVCIGKVYHRHACFSFWRTRSKVYRRRHDGWRMIGSGNRPIRWVEVQ
jgi:hypothetical protein